MKHYISNRGNLTGMNSYKENSPDYIQIAIDSGFDCVVDVSYMEGVVYFGTANHLYIVDLEFIAKNNEKLWLRCANPQTLQYFFSLNNQIKCIMFLLNEQLTSNQTLWLSSYNDIQSYNQIIIVMPEWSNWKTYSNALGVCSNYIEYIREFYENNFLFL